MQVWVCSKLRMCKDQGKNNCHKESVINWQNEKVFVQINGVIWKALEEK